MPEHPITPPPELRWLWAQQAQRIDPRDPVAWQEHVATQAARWGADQELEACVEWLQDPDLNVDTYKLRAARRPKPPSKKERALKALSQIEDQFLSAELAAEIRCALEELPDD